MTSLLKKYWILITIIAVASIAGAIFYVRSVSANSSAAKNKEKTHTVTKTDVKETITISGKIDAEEKASLRFATSGKLVWVGVKTGDMVKKYQVLASLDQRDLKKNLEKKLNTYLSTRWDFEQTKDDETTTADVGLTQEVRDAAKRILDKSQFGLNNSVLDVELQSLTLEYANLWTPIDGIVTNIDTPFAGVNITPASAEFMVINPASMYLSVLPDQTEVSKITSSMSATITFDAFTDTTVPGTVTSIALTPKTGESSTVYEVKLSFPLNSSLYRIGMTADAAFTVKEKRDVLSIPLSFLKTDNGKPYVLRKVGNNKEKTTVSVGLEGDESVEITNGLAEGDILYD
jgi:RND family efflux transporter MFP subunit